jgi:hypothetical protein
MEGRSGGGGRGGRGGGPGRGGAGFALSFSLKFLHQEERKKATLDFRVNQAVNRIAAPQGSLTLLADQLKDTPLTELIREVNLDDPFFRELRARLGVTGNWEELGIDKVVVNATYQPNRAGPIVHTDGWTFNTAADPARFFNVLIDRNNPVRSYRYTTQVFLKDLPYVESKDRVLSREDVTEQRELVIHPANEFRPLIVALEPGAIDWSKTRQVDVLLKYSDPDSQFHAEQLFSFRQDRQAPQRWLVYPKDPEIRWYEVSLSYHLLDANSTYFRLNPVRSSEEALVVPGPFRGEPWRIQLIPAVDPEEVRELSAEILYEKGGYRFHHQEDFSADDLKPRWVSIPVPDPDPKTDSYQVRWSITKASYETQEFPWQPMQSSKCLLSDGVHGVETVKLVFDRTIEQAGLISLVVTLESLGPDGAIIDSDSLLLRGSASEATTQLLTLRGAPLVYRYRLKKVTSAGSQVEESANNRERRLIVEL